MRHTHRIALVALCAAACRLAPVAQALPIREVVSGCSGGFTGGGGGVALTPNGQLYTWQLQLAGAPETRRLARTDTALAADVFRRLAAMRFLEIAYAQPSNVTCFVRARTDSGTHEVAWPLNDTGAPRAVRDLFDRLKAAAPNGA